MVELHAISPDATPEEVAAITAAIAASIAQAGGSGDESVEDGSSWVRAARITARRSGYSRGEWRLSGRLGRRSHA